MISYKFVHHVLECITYISSYCGQFFLSIYTWVIFFQQCWTQEFIVKFSRIRKWAFPLTGQKRGCYVKWGFWGLLSSESKRRNKRACGFMRKKVLILGCPSAVVFCAGGSALLTSPFCKITLFLCCFKATGPVICRFLVLIFHKCTLYIFIYTIYVRCKQNDSVLSEGSFLGNYRSGPSGYKRVTLPFWCNH